MRRVGLIDITVGNAARLGASQRSTTRRCASHHIATQRANRWGHPGGSRAFSADGPPQALSACGSETVWCLRRPPYRGLPTRLNSLCAKMTVMPKARVLVTIFQLNLSSRAATNDLLLL